MKYLNFRLKGVYRTINLPYNSFKHDTKYFEMYNLPKLLFHPSYITVLLTLK